MRVLLSAGEASGDTYAAALVEEMRRLASGGRTPSTRDGLIAKLGIDPATTDHTRLTDLEGFDSLDMVGVVGFQCRRTPIAPRGAIPHYIVPS